MKTANIFTAATLLLSVAASFFCTSCMTEYKEELKQVPVYEMTEKKAQQKNVEAKLVISDDIADFYDLKAKFEYDGKTVVEPFNTYKMDKTRAIDSNKEMVVMNVRNYSITKNCGVTYGEVAIIATPKSDAIAKVEAMPDDTIFHDYIKGTAGVGCYANSIETLDSFVMNKADFIQSLKKGEKTLLTREF
ncbi:MAG: hypothetical protein KBT32_03835 [Bacteroidales bacterium]|nr:hypothetical protein [Candidatus Physcocola equi]